jgi:outer membrane protein insertion porin family
MNQRVKRKHQTTQMVLWALVLGILSILFARGLAADAITISDDTLSSKGSETVIHDIRVVIEGPTDQQKPYGAMAERLIRLQPGDRLDEGAVQTAIDTLKLSRRFSAIHVDSISEAEGETLIFTLTPYRFIKDIQIRGKYPLFERDILNQMTLYPGDPYTRADLNAQTEAIVERYQREGYVAPKVSIKAQRGKRRPIRRDPGGYRQRAPLRARRANF